MMAGEDRAYKSTKLVKGWLIMERCGASRLHKIRQNRDEMEGQEITVFLQAER